MPAIWPFNRKRVASSKGKDLQSALQKSKRTLFPLMDRLFSGKEAERQALEELLYTADLGPTAVQQLMQSIDESNNHWNRERVIPILQQEIMQMLGSAQTLNLSSTAEAGSPLKVIVLVGVNGVGKTTTTAKLASHCLAQGKQVMLAAADTFRAAASEQLQAWATKLNVEIVRQDEGADAAAVVFDAIQSAHAKEVDILLVDTGGRLHTQHNPMQALQKICRTIEKANGRKADDILMILDANIGQNAIKQAEMFKDQVGVTGLIVSKLDSSAKAGVLVPVCQALRLPILFAGTGEQVEDLQPFDPSAFAQALLS